MHTASQDTPLLAVVLHTAIPLLVLIASTERSVLCCWGMQMALVSFDSPVRACMFAFRDCLLTLIFLQKLAWHSAAACIAAVQ